MVPIERAEYIDTHVYVNKISLRCSRVGDKQDLEDVPWCLLLLYRLLVISQVF